MELPSSQPTSEVSYDSLPLVEQREFNYRFDDVTAESLQNLIADTVARCDVLFDKSLDSEERTYDGIVAPHVEIDDILLQAYSYLSAVCMIHSDPTIRRLASKSIMDLIWDSNEYIYSFMANKKIRAYQKSDEAKILKGEQKRYLKFAVDWLDDGGFGLTRSKRQKLKKFQTCVQEFEEEFQQNIAEDVTTIILSDVEIAGLDEQSRSAFLTDLGNGQYELSLIESIYRGFLSVASDRETRRKVYQTYNSRLQGPNTLLLENAVFARQKIASLLGFKSWMDFTGKYNMVKSPKQIFDLYESLVPALTVKAGDEIAIMEEMLLADDHSGPLQVYDIEYYEARLLKEKYDVDLDMVREYLPLPAVLAGTLDLTGELFGLNFRQQNVQAWHPEVLCFEVDDVTTSKQIGTIYMDLFPRDGKYKHCCCMTLVGGRAMPDGTYRQPTSLIIGNVPPAAGGEPALLSQSQRVDVAFHEFGHALHDVLTKAKLPALAGLATEIDFVEIPSQIMENWAWDPGILKKHARHYKTGEPMPDNMIEALVDSKNVNLGIKYLQYISKGLFDLYLHSSSSPVDVVEAWERSNDILPLPKVEGVFYPAIFDHVMSSYAGSYYSYIYDEVFSTDMFRRFQEEGLYNAETGKEYRKKILEPGATKYGAEMIKNFLDRKVDGKFFLRSLGIVAPAEG